jgi:hypothetical protein
MPKPSFSVIAVTLMTIGLFVLGDESVAQRNPAPSKAGTRLITLGTASGPIPGSDLDETILAGSYWRAPARRSLPPSGAR